MATINDSELFLNIDGASEDRLRRGLAALRASLDANGVSIADAFDALRRQEMLWEPKTAEESESYLRDIKAMDLAFRAIFEASNTPLGTLIDFGILADRDEDDEELPAPHYRMPDPNQMALAL